MTMLPFKMKFTLLRLRTGHLKILQFRAYFGHVIYCIKVSPVKMKFKGRQHLFINGVRNLGRGHAWVRRIDWNGFLGAGRFRIWVLFRSFHFEKIQPAVHLWHVHFSVWVLYFNKKFLKFSWEGVEEVGVVPAALGPSNPSDCPSWRHLTNHADLLECLPPHSSVSSLWEGPSPWISCAQCLACSGAVLTEQASQAPTFPKEGLLVSLLSHLSLPLQGVGRRLSPLRSRLGASVAWEAQPEGRGCNPGPTGKGQGVAVWWRDEPARGPGAPFTPLKGNPKLLEGGGGKGGEGAEFGGPRGKVSH